MGSEELPPAKAAMRKRQRPLYQRPAFLVPIGLLLAVFVFMNHTTTTERNQASISISSNLSSLKAMSMEQNVVEAGSHAAEAEVKSKDIALGDTASASEPDVAELRIAVADGAQDLRLRLKLLPQHSQSSVDWLRQAAKAGCAGELYRSERGFLVQGRIDCAAKRSEVTTTVVKGSCPPDVTPDPHRQCPSHDPQCGCHGPIMEYGMVGWAGGSAGPDFFIYIGKGAARHWAHDHTVFAQVADAASWETIEALGRLPVRMGGMTFFQDKIRLKVASPGAP